MWTKPFGYALVLIAALSVAAGERQELLKALRDAELELELARRRVPPSFDAGSIRVDLPVQRTALPDVTKIGRLALHRVEFSGSHEDVVEFVHRLSIHEIRAGDLETLQSDGKRFTARVVLPVYAGGAMSTDLSSELETIRATQAAIDGLRWTRARDALALLDSVNGTHVHVTSVSVGEEATIEGVLAGAPSRKALLARIAEAGFAVPRLRMSPSGACRSFALVARRGEAATETSFDLAPSPLCRADVEPAVGRIVVRGAKTDGLTLHFRRIDVADLFFVLHDVTGESFVIDPDVKGSFDVDVEKATLGEVLAAIRRPDIVIGNGPLRRVSRPNAQMPESKDYAGDPVNLILSDADLRAIVCLYEEITGLKFNMSPDVRTRSHVYVRERPWDEVLDALLAGARLRYSVEGTTVLAGGKANVSACTSRGRSSLSDSHFQLRDLGASDLELAGVAGEKAYVYDPWRRRLLVIEKGTRVFDGAVQSVGRSGVRFAIDGGLVFDLR